MADKSTQLVIDALSRAAADLGGVPLHGNKKNPGLFATSAVAKGAAQRCLEDGYLHVLRKETSRNKTQQTCAITEKGLAFLLSQVSPKHVLEDLVHMLEARHSQVNELVAVARQWQAGLQTMQATVEKVLQQVQKPGVVGPTPSANGSDIWPAQIVAYLAHWHDSGDCPLPQLFARAKESAPSLTVGHFHDGLRRLHEQERIYLHPWTGPLYEIPEPACALLVGHEVAYYASVRPPRVSEKEC